MSKFIFPIQIRWSDIDANRHLRHSAYYDYAATARMQLLYERGLTTEKLEEFQIGPILFREEAIFRREIRLEDKISLEVEITKASPDYSRWSLRHVFYKSDGTMATQLFIDCAWMDLVRRKLTQPNAFMKEVFESLLRSAEFEWLDVPEKR